MTDSPTQRQRRLLADLEAAVRRHASEVQAAEAAHAQATTAATRALEQALEEIEQQHAKTHRSVDAELKTVRQRLAARHDERLAAAEQAAATELRAFTAQTNAIESKAREGLDERRWLAETMLESANKKALQEFDAARTQTDALLRELAAIESAAVTMLAQSGHEPMTLPEGATPVPALPDVVRLLDALERRTRHFVIAPAFIISTVLAAGAAGGIAAAFGAGAEASENLRRIGLWAAGGATGATAVMLGLRAFVRSSVPASRAALAQAVASARRGAEAALASLTERRDAAVGTARLKRERELDEAEVQAKEATRTLQVRREQEEPALRQRHGAAVQALREAKQAELEAVERSAAEHRAAADAKRADATEKVRAEHRAMIDAAGTAHARTMSALQDEWRAAVEAAARGQAEFAAWMERVCPIWDAGAWTATGWREGVPPGEVPDAVSMGWFEASPAAMPGGMTAGSEQALAMAGALPGGVVRLPLLLDLAEGGSLLLQHGAEGRAEAIAALNDAMLRIMTSVPPSKARFTIVDPVGLGQSFAAFTHLADHDEQLITDRVWSDVRHVEQRLAELTEHMETVIQKYLRNEYATIREYNAMAGEVAEPMRFLVLADLPAGISEQAAKRLASIIASGARCGVHVLAALDERTKPPAWLPVADLAKGSLHLRHQQGRWVRQEPAFRAWPLALERPPAEATATALLRRVGEQSKELGRVRVPFEIVAPQSEAEVWSRSTRDEVRVALGRTGATKLQHLLLGQGTAQHALIAGRTGSGKSTLLHVIITNAALWHSPDEIEMYLVDFKKGVEFKAYAAHGLPHARVIAVESEREFGLSVLRRLDAELTSRGQRFRDRNVQDLAGWRRSSPEPMPRVLLVVDEFQEFFVEDDKLAQEASLLLDRLVRQGRAFGMHVVLGSQTLGGAYSLARSTLGQMAVRIALQCSEADSYLIMSEDNPAPRLLSRPGEAIYNDASGMLEGNSPFQIVWLSEETREAMLDRVRARGRGSPARECIVFEGDRASEIGRNPRLAAIREGREPAPAVPTAWLGEAVSIKEATNIAFRRQAAANLLIVGQQEDTAHAMMTAAATALAADQRTRLVVIDSTPADQREHGVLERMANAQDPSGPTRFAGPRGAAAAVAEVAAEVARREALAQDPEAKLPETSLFVLVMGLHRFRDLRKVEDFSFGASEGASRPDQQLAKVLRDGPALGVHVVAWIDTAANVDRTLERATAREFEARVLMQMSANDSTNLIDTPAAANLGRHRALLHREELGTVEKFRPYAPFAT
ncbi:MAG: FtsK/SpoIIIE domain-containing protein [Phycisphaerae bacterium]